MKNTFKRFFNFQGRANRTEFWIYAACLAGGSLAAVFLLMTVTLVLCAALCDSQAAQGCGWIGVGISILLVWAGVPVLLAGYGARRLHDSNKSGWWLLLCLLPYLGVFIVLILMLLPGTKGANRFGPPPQV